MERHVSRHLKSDMFDCEMLRWRRSLTVQPCHAAMLFTTLDLVDRSLQDGAKLQETSSAFGLNTRGRSFRDPAPTQGARGPALPCTRYLSAVEISVGEISAKM